MVKIFIYCKEKEYLKKLFGQIQLISDSKILGVSTTLSQSSIEFCKENKPNVIIANNLILQELKEILDFIFIPLCIKETSRYSLKIVTHQLKKITSNSKYTYKLEIINYRNLIYKELIRLDFNPNMLGTTYLIDCIVCSRENPYSQLTRLELENYYNKISHKYCSNKNFVKWDIQKSVENMHKHSSRIESYFDSFNLINRFKFLY